MQIVIKIDEKLYKDIYSDAEIMIYGGMRSGKTLLATLLRAIRNSTPLPKGHGRLIDADKALDYFTTNMNWVDEEDNRIDNSAERKAIFKEYFDGVSTILEADMNREGEK